MDFHKRYHFNVTRVGEVDRASRMYKNFAFVKALIIRIMLTGYDKE